MREFGKDIKLNDLNVKPHSILFSYTSPYDYEMSRDILLEQVEGLKHSEYLLLNGDHCSCYDFDETSWDATVYTKEELITLANADYNKESAFWKMIRNYF